MVALLMGLAVLAPAASIAYAECEDQGGGGTYVPPAPILSASAVQAGTSVTVTGYALAGAGLYAAYLNQYAYNNNTGGWTYVGASPALGPHDWEATPDSAGTLEPIDLDLPTGLLLGYTYYIYLQSTDGEVTDGSPITVTASAPAGTGDPCPPDDRGNGLIGPNGGLYGRMNSKGCEKHHLPSKDSFKNRAEYSKYCAPAIRMLYDDHIRTPSHGRLGAAAKTFRLEERRLVDAGQFREAFELNVRNPWGTGIEDLFPGKYSAAIEAARRAIDEIPACRGG